MSRARLRDELRVIRERCARLPVVDGRTTDEILGHDDDGLPRREEASDVDGGGTRPQEPLSSDHAGLQLRAPWGGYCGPPRQ